MKVRIFAAAAAAAGALALGSAALAQEEKKSETSGKPEASEQHRGGHHGPHGMGRMRGGCHGES